MPGPFDQNDLENPGTTPPGTPPVGTPPAAPPAAEPPWFVPGKFKTQADWEAHEAQREQELNETRQRAAQPPAPRTPQFDPYTGQPINPNAPPTEKELEQQFWNNPIRVMQNMMFQGMLPVVDQFATKDQLKRLRDENKDVPKEVWKELEAEVVKEMAAVDPRLKVVDKPWDMVVAYKKDQYTREGKIKPPVGAVPPATPPGPTHVEAPTPPGVPPKVDRSKSFTEEELESEPWKEFNMTEAEWVAYKSPFGVPQG